MFIELVFEKAEFTGILSTEEAEVYAAMLCNEGARSVAWLLNILDELNLKYELPVMYEDCNNAILWINERKSTMRSRHFQLRLEFIREMVQDNLLKVEYINTSENPADMKNKHSLFSKKVGLRNINSEEVLN